MSKYSVHVSLEWRVNGEDKTSGGRVEVEAKSEGHAEQLAVAQAKAAQGVTSLHRCKVLVRSTRKI